MYWCYFWVIANHVSAQPKLYLPKLIANVLFLVYCHLCFASWFIFHPGINHELKNSYYSCKQKLCMHLYA